MKATLFRELSDTSEIIDIQEGVSLEANFPDIDFDKRIVLVNGKESDKSHIVKCDDIIAIRSVPGVISAGLAAVLIVAGVALGGAIAVTVGTNLYNMKQQLSGLEETFKNMKEDVKSIPYLKGGYNNVATGKTQPYIVGEHLFTPFLLAPAFSKIAGVDGCDQYFHAVLENGFNNQVIRKLYCDDVSLKDWGNALTVPQEGVFTFDETSPFYDASSLIEVAQDGNDFSTAILNKKTVSEQSGAQLLKSDNADYEDLLYTLQPKTRAVEIVIMINGLRQYGSDGSKNNRTIEVIPEYQLTDGGAWTAFTFDQNGTPSNTFTRNKMEQMRFCARKDFTYAQVKDLTAPVKVRLRCTTPAYDGSAHDQVYCQWVQSEIYDPIASATAGDFVDEKIIGDNERALSTLIGLKIKASASNQDKLSKINCITAGVARTWNGTAWSAGKTPTRNPAAWLLETLTSPTHLASQVDDTEIDLDSFGELYEQCETDGLAVDMVLVDGDTKESVLAAILETCFSVLYRDIYGNITVAIDTAKTDAIALLNTQNVISFSNEKSLARRTDGIKITYTSRDAGYAQSSYIVMRDGVARDADSIIRDINITGITEYNHIVKYARRIMAIESLRPKSVTVEVGKEGTYFTPLSKVLVQHPSLKIGLGSAEIKSVITNATHITGLELYEPVEYDAGYAGGYGAIIACVGDDYYTPLAAAYTADSARDTEITFVTPILKGAAVIPHAGDVLSYGKLSGGTFSLVTSPMLVMGISPTDTGYSLQLADYSADVYTVGAIPAYVPNFTDSALGLAVPQTPASATLEDIADAIVLGQTYNGAAPADVTSIDAKAFQDYIKITWPEPTVAKASDAPVGYILQRSVDSGTTWKDIAGVTNGTARVQGSTYYWDFARATDGYPEKTENKGWIPLSSYRFRVKAVNAAGVASAGWATDSSVDATAYKSWMPTVPSPSGSTSMRTASLSWTDELAAYGRLRFEGQISIDNTNWFQPASGLDAYGAETNWRQSATANLFNQVSMPAWTQMLPLSGQLAGNPVSTTYYFRFRSVLDCPWTGSEGVGASSGGKRASAWSSAVTVLAKANGAYDLVSGAIVNQLKADSAGLMGMWTSDGMKEYPDNPAGTAYFQDAWTTVDEWVVTRGTIVPTNGLLTLTSNAVNMYISRDFASFPGATQRTIRIKLSGVQSATYGRVYYKTAGHSYSDSYYKNITIPLNGGVLDIDMATLTKGGTDWTSSNITGVRLDFGKASGQVFVLDWIYIGDGTYSTTARDISGQGNHGTVVGATPLADGGYSFDGNDYISIPGASSNHPQAAISVCFLAKSNDWAQAVGNTETHTVLGCTEAGGYCFNLHDNRGYISFPINIAGVYKIPKASINLLSDSNYNLIVGTYDGASVKLYINGVLIDTVSATGSIFYTYTNPIIIGAEAGSTGPAGGYFDGTVSSPRIYNRALTDAEVLALYQNPNTGLPGTIIAERIFTQNLAAIQGLFASVAGGGDDELNYWNLSAVPQGSRPVGSFRAGNVTVYEFVNPAATGTLEDPYIALIAGNDYIKLTGTGIVMSDTLMAKVGASSATIDAIFTQAIEVGDGGYSYYFAGSGTTRKAIRVGSNEVSWGTYPTGGLFAPSNIITQPTTDKYATLIGDFRTPVKTGDYSYAESSLSVTASSKSALLVLRNKTWLLAYPTSNGVVYTNTRVNGVWGTPTNAIGISTYYMCLRELPNGNVILVYSKYTNRKLYCKIYDGTTWGNELLIADTPVYDVSVEIAQNGDATVIYNKVTPNPGLYATLGTASSSYTTWTVEATPIFSDGSIVDVTTAVNTEGVICIVFLLNTAGYKIARILGKYGSGWSAPAAIINSPDYTNLSLVNFLDGQLGLICKNTSHYPCLFKTVRGSWGAVNVLTNVQRWNMDFTFNQATNTIEGVCVDGSGNLREVSISDTANCRIGAGIIESGVAPDGSRWQKTSDGMLECWGWGYVTWVSGTSAQSKNITFPSEFSSVDAPDVWVTFIGESSTNPTGRYNLSSGAVWANAKLVTPTGFQAGIVFYTNLADTQRRAFSWRAKGLAKA